MFYSKQKQWSFTAFSPLGWSMCLHTKKKTFCHNFAQFGLLSFYGYQYTKDLTIFFSCIAYMPFFLTYYSCNILLSILHLFNINKPLLIVLKNFKIAYNNQPTIFEVTDSKVFAVCVKKSWQTFFKIANTISILIQILIGNNKRIYHLTTVCKSTIFPNPNFINDSNLFFFFSMI